VWASFSCQLSQSPSALISSCVEGLVILSRLSPGDNMIPNEGIMVPYWVEAKDNLDRDCASHCGCVDHCKSVVGAWVVMPSCVGFVCHRGSSDWSSGHCVWMVDVVL
jgi:hypothetical protein